MRWRRGLPTPRRAQMHWPVVVAFMIRQLFVSQLFVRCVVRRAAVRCAKDGGWRRSGRAFATSASSAGAGAAPSVAFDFYATMVPHPAKAAKGGEDSYFAQPFALGVSDGVGGWAGSGVDPALFSRALTKGAESLALQGRQRRMLIACRALRSLV
jgi:hypothetical protein